MLLQTANLLAQNESETAQNVVIKYLAAARDWISHHLSLGWLMEYVNEYGPNLFGAIVVFVIGRWVARIATNTIVRAAKKARVDETLVSFLKNLIYMVLLTIVSISALGKLGVNLNDLTAVLAAAGFAIGMAMQGSLGNLAAGVMLVFFKPFPDCHRLQPCRQRGTA